MVQDPTAGIEELGSRVAALERGMGEVRLLLGLLVEPRFQALTQQWKQDTAHLSSTTAIAMLQLHRMPGKP